MMSHPILTILFMHMFCIAGILGSMRMAEFELSACAVVSSWLQLLSLCLRAVQLFSGGGAVSKRSLTLELLSIGCRLSSTTVKNGYLPIDATGDFMYQFVDVCSFVVALVLRRWAPGRQRQCLHADADRKLSVIPVIVLALLSASLCHGCENASPIFDTLWMTGLFLGLCASIPQRLLLHYMTKRIPFLIQYSMMVTYCGWMINGRLMITVFVYYLGSGEVSLFSCSIVVVYVLAAWLFLDCLGTIISGSTAQSAACSKQLANLEEVLQSKRLPLLGGLRRGCMIFSVMLLVCALSAHRAQAIKDGSRFVSMQLRLAFIFLNIVVFTENSRKQARALRNSFGHAFLQIQPKLSRIPLDQGKCPGSKQQVASGSSKCQKGILKATAVDDALLSAASKKQQASELIACRRGVPKVTAVDDCGRAPCASSLLRRAQECILTTGVLASSLRQKIRACITCRLNMLSLASVRHACWSGAKSLMQDRRMQGAMVGISMLFAGIFFSDRNMLILYGAGFLYTAVVTRASRGLQGRVAANVSRKGTSLSKATTECSNATEDAYIASQSTATREASEDRSTKDVSQTFPGVDISGLKESSGSDATPNETLEYETAIGRAVDASAFEQSWSDSERFDAESIKKTGLGCEPAVGQGFDAPGSKQSFDDWNSDDEVTAEPSLGCQSTVTPAIDVSASKQSWGDLESSDDDFFLHARACGHHAVKTHQPDRDNQDSYLASGAIPPWRRRVDVRNDDKRWHDYSCRSQPTSTTINTKCLPKPCESNHERKTIALPSGRKRRKRTRNREQPTVGHVVDTSISHRSWDDSESSDADVTVVPSPGCESASGQADDTSRSMQCSRGLENVNDLAFGTSCVCEPSAGQAVDTATSIHLWDDMETANDLAFEAWPECKTLHGRAVPASTSKPSWGDLESSDDDFLVRARTSVHLPTQPDVGGYNDELAWLEIQKWFGEDNGSRTKVRKHLTTRLE